jgi:predicted enzyme related to lactoylglutathione lyase
MEDHHLGGMFDLVPDMQMPPCWLYYITVADLDAALERVKSHGGQILNGPMEVPGSDRVAQCMDPQGAAFALHSSPAA